MVYRAISVMSRAITGINRLCSVPHVRQHCLCLCSLSTNIVIVFRWNSKGKLLIAVLNQIYRRSYDFICLEFAMQFYTQQHRVILGVTASVIPRDTLFIRILIMKLITHCCAWCIDHFAAIAELDKWYNSTLSLSHRLICSLVYIVFTRIEYCFH